MCITRVYSETDVIYTTPTLQLNTAYELHSIRRSERKFPIFDFKCHQTGFMVTMHQLYCTKEHITLKCNNIYCKAKVKVRPAPQICKIKMVHNSPRVRLDFTQEESFNINSYTVASVLSEHSCDFRQLDYKVF